MSACKESAWRSIRKPSWALAACGYVLAACGSEPRPPNVLFVSIDMLRADHVSCYGYARPTTPNLDRLAREGVLFEDQIASTSWTLPSHAALFTGLPDSLHGASDSDRVLGSDHVTIAERFAAAGYETAGFFSGPYLHPAFGFAQGFERYQDCSGANTSPSAGQSAGDGRSSGSGASEQGSIVDNEALKHSHADVVNPITFDHVERWFRGRSERPFFAFVHLWDAHYDFVPPPPYDTQFDPGYTGPIDGRGFVTDARIHPGMPRRDLEHLLALYDGEIAWTDSFLARLRALLEEQGLLDNTIVVVTSDHGTEFFEHGQKGHRKSLYDEVTHVPLVVRFPKSLPAGARVKHQTRGVDVAPTILDLAGLPPLENVWGMSLAELARDPTRPFPELALSELDTQSHALRSLRGGDWKVFQNRERGHECALDLESDPRETTLECRPDHPLVRHALAALAALDKDLASLKARRPGMVPSTSTVPAAVQDHLRALGYTGADETPR